MEEEMSSQEENGKVRCHNGQAFDNILLMMDKLIHRIIANSDCNIEVKEMCKKRFLEVFNKAMESNVAIGYGKDKETVTDFDDEKVQALIDDLMMKLDISMVSATQMRKTGPHLIRSNLKRIMKTELKYLALVKLAVEDRGPEIDVLRQSLPENLYGSQESNQLTDLQKVSADLLHQTQNLRETLQQNSRFKKSEVYRALYESPSTTPVKTKPAFLLSRPGVVKKL